MGIEKAKKVLFNTGAVFFSATVFFIGLELAASGYYFYKNGHFFGRNLAKEERKQVIRQMTGDEPGNLSYVQRWRWENSLSLHPFFGYTQNPKLPGVNNYGFETAYDFDLCDNRYCLNPQGKDRTVIGIFGGSFAALTAQQGVYLEKQLMKAGIPNPVVVNFAFGGQALPQSFYIFEYFRELVDVAVFIDGVNEVWNFVENNKSGGPPEYAKVAHFKYKLSVSEMSAGNFNNTLKIMIVNQLYLGLTRVSLLPVLEYSLAVQGGYGLITKFKDKFITERMRDIEESYFSSHKFYEVSDETLLQFAAERWAEYHRLIRDLSSRWGMLSLHFLQPNAYLEGSKVLTDSEEEIVSRETSSKEYIRRGYPLLRKKLDELITEGFLGKDLTSIYQDTKETVWVDPHHANPAGYFKVLDEVSFSIRENFKQKKMGL